MGRTIGIVTFKYLVYFIQYEVSVSKQPMFGAIHDKNFPSTETKIVSGKKLLSTTVDKETFSNNGKYCKFKKKII